MKVFYSPEYTASTHAFDTTLKSQWVAESLLRDPIDGVELVRPHSLNVEELAGVHDLQYVQAVQCGSPRGLAGSPGIRWDEDLWTATTASAGGIVDAALAGLRTGGVAGSLSSGLHHAYRTSGRGFCTFNGLALAAATALDAGAESVLIVDFDAHCGGGTASLVQSDPRIWQADVSVDWFDFYDQTDRCKPVLVSDGESYLTECSQALSRIDHIGPNFDLVLYNAGMDPYEGCDSGGLDGITREVLDAREHLLFSWCQAREVPVAFALAGGYVGTRLDEKELVDLHRLTISEASLLD
ncbi:hypothetical protein [Rhodococcus marinonascens]|uniref:hypothetical protein n=1 Tax=Rhodococcus marinonascens TaxID=38311 RepID=UPI00093447A6|nr:hypothetical protein [Rhodococcus marinonascens]